MEPVTERFRNCVIPNPDIAGTKKGIVRKFLPKKQENNGLGPNTLILPFYYWALEIVCYHSKLTSLCKIDGGITLM